MTRATIMAGAGYCFSKEHGHRYAVTTWSDDTKLGRMSRGQVRQTYGEAGEGLYDLEKDSIH